MPDTYAIVCGCAVARTSPATAVDIGGMNAGVAIPTTLTSQAHA